MKQTESVMDLNNCSEEKLISVHQCVKIVLFIVLINETAWSGSSLGALIKQKTTDDRHARLVARGDCISL